MDYRASSTAAAALPKKLGSANGAFTGTSIYDGVFSGSAHFRGSSFSSRADDFGEIFGDSRGGSSIPVLDVPALRERKVSVDVRSSRLEYSNIFGGSGGCQGVASHKDLPADSKKMRNFAREERARVGTRSPSEVSFSGSEDNQVLPHLSDKAKKFNMSYNRSNLGSQDRTNGTTHVTQLHDVPGFARVIDGTDAARNGDEKAKSFVFDSTPEKQHTDFHRNGSPSNGMPPNEYGTPSPSRFFTNNFNSKGDDSRYEASPSKVSDGGDGNLGSPPYFEEELDANSAAAASAAAVRKAIEQAQARIKTAKEIMERRKDMFQGNGYFNGLGAEKRREGKKAKKAIKFSEMEENAQPKRFATSQKLDKETHLNTKDVSGQALEFRCAETQAQPCIRQRDSMDGDEGNETKILENKVETSEKKSDDYEMKRMVTAESSCEVPVGTGKARDILENSNLAKDYLAHERDEYKNDHESAEQLHYLEENKEEFEVEQQRNEEKKLETQSMDCVWEGKGKKPNESNEEEVEEEEEEGRRSISDLGKKVHGKDEDTVRLEEHEKEYDGFCLGAEPKELDADTEELLEKFDCLLDGKENQEHREEDNYSEMQQDAFEQMENEDVRTEDESHKIQDPSRYRENRIYGADECRYTEHEEDQDRSENEVKPEDDQRMKEETESVADNADSEERKVTVDDSNLEEARGIEAFRLSWGSLNVGEVKKKVEVTEITGLNENTFKLRFTDINIEPETTGDYIGKHSSGLVSELHEDYNDVIEDDTSSSSSGKGEAEAFTDDQEVAEDELSEYDDSLVDSEVNIEADWQPEMFEKKEETVEAKLNQSSDQEEEIWSVETAKEEKSEPQKDSIKKTDEEKKEEMKVEPERHSMEKTDEEREKERERERERVVVERAIREARERAFAEARERAERASVEKATAEARQRMMAQAQEKMAKASAAEIVNNKPPPEGTSNEEARLRAQRAAVERATAEARERALEKALSDKLSGHGRDNKTQQRSSNEPQQKSFGSSSNSRNSSSSNGGPQSGGVNGESGQRSKAKLERHQQTAERAAKALAEKNMRDLLAQREQAEKNRLAEALDADIKRWSSGKHGNLRALLSTLQYILSADSGWQAVSLTEIVTSAAVKKAYRRATLCVHPDKLQQRGASLQQKYVCEKVFDLLKEAWNRFSAEEK